ncbi:hypothetical protein OEA41_000081 [Lepraria neglecta]|uniref:Aminoglycoside phosphotransferase domain-containing protein n=1 Tax=Lepraria neglecta TaxID=209136 RepID=A0AAD9ZFK9_9LECA|nr:hypothetical protein OEA41_000081 [Lepraria neglecta]
MNQVWSTYTGEEKNAVARDIAKLIVEMTEINFDGIGGLTLAHKLGPTVEGVKLFKGRDTFHSPSCYDIGPYFSTRAYILACYDKEIYYHAHAPEADVDMELFEETSKSAFIESLKATRDALTASPTTGLPEQPFVLAHGDFHGRNIMTNENKQISAILD